MSIQAAASSFSGPLPPPEILVRYDEIVPGSANRIITMAENQAGHREKQEAFALRSDANRSTLGLICGFIVAIAFLAASVGLVVGGYPVPGTVIGSVDILGLVSAFIYGTKSKREEREDRIQALSQIQQRRR